MQKKLALMFLIATLFSFSYFVYSDHPIGSDITFPPDQIERDLALIKASYYNFDILFLPDEVEVKAGENVTLDISVVNIGSYALREFSLSLSGIEYPYEITPSGKTDVLVWGDWDSVNGLMRGKKDYKITINVPANATDVHLVNVTGMENFSWRRTSKSGTFILKVIPAVSIEQNISVSKVVVPDFIMENEPFHINFSLKNTLPSRQRVDLVLAIPPDWVAVEGKKTYILEPQNDTAASLTVIPTNSSGNISADVVYPFKKQIFALSKIGPSITQIIEEPKEEVKKPTGLAALVEFLRNLSPIFLAILVLILVIVIWFITKLVRFYSGRKKPEE